MSRDKTRTALEKYLLLVRLEAERDEFDMLWQQINLHEGHQERNRFRTIAMLAQGSPYHLIRKDLEISEATLHNTKRRFLLHGTRGLLTRRKGRGNTEDPMSAPVLISVPLR